MAATNPALSQVTFRTYNWRDEVLKAWGEQWGKPDIAYEFTARTFDDSGGFAGIYAPTHG